MLRSPSVTLAKATFTGETNGPIDGAIYFVSEQMICECISEVYLSLTGATNVWA